MPRPDVSEERISQIIEASLAVFAREGFAQARMDDIAKEAGLSKGALYLYFKSKDAIIAAILKVFFRTEMRFLRVYHVTEAPIADQLLDLTRQIATAVDRMRALMPIAFEFYAIAGRQPDVRAFLIEYFNEYIDFFRSIIQVGIERGEFAIMDARSVAIAITAFYEGLVLCWVVDPHSIDWMAQAENTMRLIIRGMRP